MNLIVSYAVRADDYFNSSINTSRTQYQTFLVSKIATNIYCLAPFNVSSKSTVGCLPHLVPLVDVKSQPHEPHQTVSHQGPLHFLFTVFPGRAIKNTSNFFLFFFLLDQSSSVMRIKYFTVLPLLLQLCTDQVAAGPSDERRVTGYNHGPSYLSSFVFHNLDRWTRWSPNQPIEAPVDLDMVPTNASRPALHEVHSLAANPTSTTVDMPFALTVTPDHPDGSDGSGGSDLSNDLIDSSDEPESDGGDRDGRNPDNIYRSPSVEQASIGPSHNTSSSFIFVANRQPNIVSPVLSMGVSYGCMTWVNAVDFNATAIRYLRQSELKCTAYAFQNSDCTGNRQEIDLRQPIGVVLLPQEFRSVEVFC